MSQLIKIWEKKGLSRETLLKEVRNRNLLGDEFDPVLEAKLLDQLGPEPAAEGDPPSENEVNQDENKTAEDLANFPPGQNRPKKQI